MWRYSFDINCLYKQTENPMLSFCQISTSLMVVFYHK